MSLVTEKCKLKPWSCITSHMLGKCHSLYLDIPKTSYARWSAFREVAGLWVCDTGIKGRWYWICALIGLAQFCLWMREVPPWDWRVPARLVDWMEFRGTEGRLFAASCLPCCGLLLHAPSTTLPCVGARHPWTATSTNCAEISLFSFNVWVSTIYASNEEMSKTKGWHQKAKR